MKYLLDTNVCIRVLNGRDAKIALWLSSRSSSDVLAVCSVVKAEMYYGAAKSQKPETNRQQPEAFFRRFISYDFDDAAAHEYAGVRAQLESIGAPIGANDLLIAAIAIANDLTLITRNLGEFSRVPRLRMERLEAD